MHEAAATNSAPIENREKKPTSGTPPVLLNLSQVADLLGVSTRQVHILRDQDWFPASIELGPRALRWHRDELLAAVAARAPRVTKREEPQRLAEAREGQVYRSGARVGAAALRSPGKSDARSTVSAERTAWC
jgi:predicted DNA-binding transcriptional regulator AlpA